MSTALAPLAFEDNPIRIVGDDEPVFVATDVARMLGYAEAKDLTRTLDEDEKGRHIVPTPGGTQDVLTITEAGLYRAIVQRRASDALPPDKKAQIVRFQRWVFHEVLPSIRRTGGYEMPTPPRPSPKEVASAFRSFASIGRIIGLDKNQAAIAANQATMKFTGVNALEAMGSTHLISPDQERWLTPTQIGRELGLGENGGRPANLLLAERGMQAKSASGEWEPTEYGKTWGRYQDTGKRHGSGTPVQQLKWLASVVDELRKVDGSEAA